MKGNEINKYLSIIIIVTMIILPTYHFASADIHKGYVEFRGDPGWDFSDSTYSNLYWDLDYGITKNNILNKSQFVVLVGPCANCIMYSDSIYEELTTAPNDTTLYTLAVWALDNQTYILRTRENHFVKFRVLVSGYPLIIEYTYQDDGSQIVPIEITTWGRIKAIYAE